MGDEKKTAETLATEAGLLPQLIARPAEGRRPARTVANKDFWKFAAARAGEGWAVGQEMTKAEFDEAVEHWTTKPHFGGRDVGAVAQPAPAELSESDSEPTGQPA